MKRYRYLRREQSLDQRLPGLTRTRRSCFILSICLAQYSALVEAMKCEQKVAESMKAFHLRQVQAGFRSLVGWALIILAGAAHSGGQVKPHTAVHTSLATKYPVYQLSLPHDSVEEYYIKLGKDFLGMLEQLPGTQGRVVVEGKTSSSVLEWVIH